MPELEEQYARALEQIGRRPEDMAEDGEAEALVGIETVDGEDPGAAEAPATPAVSINIFNHPDSHPVVLGMALLKKYGPEWLLWETETLMEAIPGDFRTAGVSSLAMDKIQAVRTIHVNDFFWTRWEVFNWCVQPLAGTYPDFEFLQAPSPGQMMVAIDCASRIRTGVPWSVEVEEYIRQSCRFAGVFCPPAPLDFLDVGTVHGLVDCEEIAKQWPAVKKKRQASSSATIVAEQLRRNLEAYLYLEESRKRLEAQLQWVLNV